MLGYATSAADLARGADLTRAAHRRPGPCSDEDGVFRVVGRLARFAKVYGLRVDLDARRGRAAPGRGDGPGAATTTAGSRSSRPGPPTPTAWPSWSRTRPGCRGTSSASTWSPELPLTSHGKRDDAPLRRLLLAGPSAEHLRRRGAGRRARCGRCTPRCSGAPTRTLDDSFVSLRGDSLSFVEADVRLVELLGDVPPDWPRRTVRELGAARREPASRSTAGLTGAARSVAPVAPGRLVAAAACRGDRARRRQPHRRLDGARRRPHPAGAGGLQPGALPPRRAGSRAARRPEPPGRWGCCSRSSSPPVLVMATVAALRGTYDPTTVVGLNNLLGADEWTDQWRMWFVEAITWGLLAVVAACCGCPRSTGSSGGAVPHAAGAARRHAGAAVGLDRLGGRQPAALLAALRLELPAARVAGRALDDHPAAGRRPRRPPRVATVGFFGDPLREAVVLGALLLLTWVPAGAAAPSAGGPRSASWPPRRCGSTWCTGRSTRRWRRSASRSRCAVSFRRRASLGVVGLDRPHSQKSHTPLGGMTVKWTGQVAAVPPARRHALLRAAPGPGRRPRRRGDAVAWLPPRRDAGAPERARLDRGSARRTSCTGAPPPSGSVGAEVAVAGQPLVGGLVVDVGGLLAAQRQQRGRVAGADPAAGVDHQRGQQRLPAPVALLGHPAQDVAHPAAAGGRAAHQAAALHEVGEVAVVDDGRRRCPRPRAAARARPAPRWRGRARRPPSRRW